MLSKREQAALLRRANSIVSREWMLHLTMLIFYAAIPFAWWVSHEESVTFSPLMVILVIATVATIFVLRTLIVRLVVRTLASHHTHSS